MTKKWTGRSALDNIQPYSPGKSIASVEKELGLTEVYKMASNENPLGPSKKAIAAIKDALPELNIYPDGNCELLKAGIAEEKGIDAEQIIVGNGSDEVIKLIAESFLDECSSLIMGYPSFSEYAFAGHLMGATVKKVPLVDYTYDLEGILKAVDETTKMIVICNPNNPTGTMVGKEALVAFMNKVPEDVIVIFDEAYGEYSGNTFYSGLNFVKEGRDNVIVLNTFSKIFGLAALRVGYGIGSSVLIKWIHRVKEPFNVNNLAQVGALAALTDIEHLDESTALNESGKAYLYDAFKKRGLSYYETYTNFIWVNVGADSVKVFEALLKKGIIIRQGSVFSSPEFIRVTIGTREENERFIESLDKVLNEI